MTPDEITSLLQRYHRQIRLIRVVRIALILGTLAVILWASQLPAPLNKQVMFGVFIATLMIWVVSLINTSQQTRLVRTAGALLGIGQLDNAEVWLQRALRRFTLSIRTNAMVLQHFASLLFRRDAHEQVVQICRSLLKQHFAGLRQIWVNTRLMMADSLLMLDEVAEAYEAIRPVCDVELSLADRMKLLPIQLRYELAADYPDSALQNLPEKLQLAELLDAPRAALVHALLAEACRRTHKPEQEAYLARRARLYHDLEPIASRYPIIAVVAGSAPGSG